MTLALVGNLGGNKKEVGRNLLAIHSAREIFLSRVEKVPFQV
jgi:hypothetical protein